MIRLKTKIISNEKVSQDVRKMAIYAPEISVEIKPGQFIHVKCGDNSRPLLRRPFSVHCYSGDAVEILYKLKGEGTKILAQKKPNEAIDIMGPLGNGFEIKPSGAILVAGGIGVAPLVALIDEMNKKSKTTVLIGAKNSEEILCSEHFKNKGAEVIIATEDGSLGKKGLITASLENLAKQLTQETEIYACGPNAMLKEVSNIAAKNNLNAQVSLEEHMACGIGVCLGCAVKTKSGYKMVCKDGPVFNSHELDW